MHGKALRIGKPKHSAIVQGLHTMSWPPIVQKRSIGQVGQNCLKSTLKSYKNARTWDTHWQTGHLLVGKQFGTSSHTVDTSLWQMLGSFDCVHSQHGWSQTILPCGKYCTALSIGNVPRRGPCWWPWRFEINIGDNSVNLRKSNNRSHELDVLETFHWIWSYFTEWWFAPGKHFRTILQQTFGKSPTFSNFFLNWWWSRHDVGTFYTIAECFGFCLFEISFHASFAWPSISQDQALCPNHVTFQLLWRRFVIRIFLSLSIILSFDLHSRWVHPRYTWSRNDVGSPRSTNFIHFFHIVLRFFPPSNHLVTNKPCGRCTKRHSQFGTFHRPSPNRTLSTGFSLSNWELSCGKYCPALQIGIVSGLWFCSKSTSLGILCIFGSRTLVPISWMCKKQTSAIKSKHSIKSSLPTGFIWVRLMPHPQLDTLVPISLTLGSGTCRLNWPPSLWGLQKVYSLQGNSQAQRQTQPIFCKKSNFFLAGLLRWRLFLNPFRDISLL